MTKQEASKARAAAYAALCAAERAISESKDVDDHAMRIAAVRAAHGAYLQACKAYSVAARAA